MKVTVRNGSNQVDKELAHLTRATIRDIAVACGLPPGPLAIDGIVHPSDLPVSGVAIADGSLISQPGAGNHRYAGNADTDMVAELRHVAGWGASGVTPLGPGDYGIGQRPGLDVGPGPVEDPDFYLRLTATGARVRSGEQRQVTVDSQPPHDVPNARHSVIGTAGSAFVIGEPVPAGAASRGRSWNRPPRTARPEPATTLTIPARPAAARGREALSWIGLIAPIPIGVVMAVLWSPIFALFILMSPVMMVGQWMEGRSSSKKDRRRFGKEFADTMDEIRADIDANVVAEQRRRRHVQPDVAALRTWVAAGHQRVWERRHDHTDFLALTLAYGDEHVVMGATGPGAGSFPEATEAMRTAKPLASVPILAELTTHQSVGIAGPRPLALAVTRSLIMQAATLHGPADVDMTLIVDPAALGEWDFMKWLPHMRGEGGRSRVATTLETITNHLPEAHEGGVFATEADQGPRRLAVIDAPALIAATGSPLRNALADPLMPLHGIIVSDDPDQLPASCGVVVEISGDGLVRVRYPQEARIQDGVIPVAIAPDQARSWACDLARYSDPEAGGASASIPSSIGLLDLLDSMDPQHIATAWKHLDLDPKPAGMIGVTESEPLWIDIANDGPHGLVAGTTGSGKSELLRTLVTSMAYQVDPDHLNFVLIDFKGGGAFDVCADLPHVVAVVTDLDEHLAERALRCLKAELRLREERLRDAGATDLGEYLRDGGTRLPRLVVIIDEFATLAAELPDFLDSLVDIAQRGRSMGVHMILATQRPSGVLDDKVKSNTNLRIALRVQDDGDSEDVIGTQQASKLSRSQPGRAFARFGQSEIVEFQTAIVTNDHTPTAERNMEVRPFDLVDEAPWQPVDVARPSPSTPSADAFTAEPTTDIAVISSAIRQAFDLAGYEPPRIPWPDPLPESLDASALAPHEGESHAFAVPLGVVDLPDRQEQRTTSWSPAVGNVLLYGIDTNDISQSIATIVLGLCQRHDPNAFHFYGLEFGTNQLAPLAGLHHCGDLVDGSDSERVLRLIGMLNEEIAQRRRMVSEGETDFPLMVVAIDNYAALTEMLEEGNEFDTLTRAAQIVRDGHAVDVYVLIGSQDERGVPMRLANLVETKLLFRLVDVNSYSAFGLRPRDVPGLGPGRFLDSESHEVGQIARYEDGDLAAAVEAIRSRHDEPATRPNSVAVLGSTYQYDAVDRAAGSVSDEGLAIPVGINASSLETTWFGLGSGEHGLVLGGSGSGKSSTLALIAAAVRTLDPAIPIVGVAHRRSELRTCPAITALVGRTTTPERLTELIDHDRVIVLVDDADTTPEPLVEVLASVANSHRDGRHMVAACRTDYPKDFEAWVQILRRDQTGIILRPSHTDGDSLRTMLPMYRPERYPVGRGFVVVASVPELAQLTLPPAGSVDHVEQVGDIAGPGEGPTKETGTQSETAAPSRSAKSSPASKIERPAGSKISLGLDTFTTAPPPEEGEAVAEVEAWHAAPRKINLGLSGDGD